MLLSGGPFLGEARSSILLGLRNSGLQIPQRWSPQSHALLRGRPTFFKARVARAGCELNTSLLSLYLSVMV